MFQKSRSLYLLQHIFVSFFDVVVGQPLVVGLSGFGPHAIDEEPLCYVVLATTHGVQYLLNDGHLPMIESRLEIR